MSCLLRCVVLGRVMSRKRRKKNEEDSSAAIRLKNLHRERELVNKGYECEHGNCEHAHGTKRHISELAGYQDAEHARLRRKLEAKDLEIQNLKQQLAAATWTTAPLGRSSPQPSAYALNGGDEGLDDRWDDIFNTE